MVVPLIIRALVTARKKAIVNLKRKLRLSEVKTIKRSVKMQIIIIISRPKKSLINTPIS